MITPGVAQMALWYGADDLDGTVSHYEITHALGTRSHRQVLTVDQLLELSVEVGRIPVERDALYNVIGESRAATASVERPGTSRRPTPGIAEPMMHPSRRHRRQGPHRGTAVLRGRRPIVPTGESAPALDVGEPGPISIAPRTARYVRGGASHQLHQCVLGAVQVLQFLPAARPGGRVRPVPGGGVREDPGTGEPGRHRDPDPGRAESGAQAGVLREPVPRHQGQLCGPDPRALSGRDHLSGEDLSAQRARVPCAPAGRRPGFHSGGRGRDSGRGGAGADCPATRILRPRGWISCGRRIASGSGPASP